MRVAGTNRRSITALADGAVEIIDQTKLPGRLVSRRLTSLAEAAEAISSMRVRGAPLIGVTAAYGLALALRADPGDQSLRQAAALLLATRPTAVNLAWALDRMREAVEPVAPASRAEAAWRRAGELAEEDVAVCRAIAEHGSRLLAPSPLPPHPSPLRLLTHCNAGWLATVDWGTALAPIYQLHDSGVPVHVWVSETRPRNQGLLTQWELAQHGVPHTLIVDNAAGLLLRRGQVDAVIVGTDRVTAGGDVVNKIGTYLKALAARESGVPFYVAAPSSSIDFALDDAAAVEIEERSGAEVAADGVPVHNPGFDVTPASLVTALITERGVAPASAAGLAALFPGRHR